jgi:hypothetical protein
MRRFFAFLLHFSEPLPVNSLPHDFCAFYQSSRSVDHLLQCAQDLPQDDVYDFETSSTRLEGENEGYVFRSHELAEL